MIGLMHPPCQHVGIRLLLSIAHPSRSSPGRHRASMSRCPFCASIRTTGGTCGNHRVLFQSLIPREMTLFAPRRGRHIACLVLPENFLREVYMNAKIVLWGGGKRQSWQKEALMIAATTGIGTAVGAIAGGKKGATIGAISGGVARFIMRMVSW